MTIRFHREAEPDPHGTAIERRLLLFVACGAALIAGATFGLTELMRDPVSGQWLSEGIDRLMLAFSVCK